MICEGLVEELFDPTEFEILRVSGGFDVFKKVPFCLVDFRRRGWEGHVDCTSYCYDAVRDYGYRECDEDDEECLNELKEDCVDYCKDKLKIALTGSISFDPVTLEVFSSTIPTDCRNVWDVEDYCDEEDEDFESIEERKREEIRKYGCKPEKADWIHPHEMVPLDMPELGDVEYPAVCYYHIKDCRVRNILRIVKNDVI